MSGDDLERHMKKYLYIMPAVLICMLYGLLAALAGGFGGFQPIAFVNICLPILAGVLLRKNKWWGSFFGIAMGLLLLYTNLQYSGHQHVNMDMPLGIAFAVYYGAMGVWCALTKQSV